MKRLLVVLLLVSTCFGQWGNRGWGRVTWQQRMIYSYLELHAPLPDGLEDALFERFQPGGYLDETFGRDGQNKKVCDFLLAYKFKGDLSGNTWVKSGDTLRWDADGTIYTDGNNNLPAHSIGSGDGYLTVSTTDGWSGLTEYRTIDDDFVGEPPYLAKAGITELTYLAVKGTSITGNIIRFADLTKVEMVYLYYTAMEGSIIAFANWTSITHISCYRNLNAEGGSSVFGSVADAHPNTTSLIYTDYRDNQYIIVPIAIFNDWSPNYYFAQFRGCRITGDLSSISALTNLEVLRIGGFAAEALEGDTEDLSPLVKLYDVNIGDAPLITGTTADLTPLNLLITLNIGECPLIDGLIEELRLWTKIEVISVNQTNTTGCIDSLHRWTKVRVFEITGQPYTGDLSVCSNMTGQVELSSDSCTALTITGNFADSLLRITDLREMGLDQAEVDRVLADFRNVGDSPGFDPADLYRIYLNGNAAPGAQGLLDITYLADSLTWTGSGAFRVYKD